MKQDKQEIRLNEQQLNKIISESVKHYLNEYGEQGYNNNQQNNYPNNQLLASFVQESEMLRRYMGQFQDSVRQLSQISQQMNQNVGFMQTFGRNLGQFGQQINTFAERFKNYCDGLLQKLSGRNQTQPQQPIR